MHVSSGGTGFGSLFAGLLRSVAPLIKRGALALGNRALKTGAQIAGDVLSGENIRDCGETEDEDCGKRFATESARDTARQTRQTSCAEKNVLNHDEPEPVKRAARRRRIAESDVFS